MLQCGHCHWLFICCMTRLDAGDEGGVEEMTIRCETRSVLCLFLKWLMLLAWPLVLELQSDEVEANSWAAGEADLLGKTVFFILRSFASSTSISLRLSCLTWDCRWSPSWITALPGDSEDLDIEEAEDEVMKPSSDFGTTVVRMIETAGLLV